MEENNSVKNNLSKIHNCLVNINDLATGSASKNKDLYLKHTNDIREYVIWIAGYIVGLKEE